MVEGVARETLIDLYDQLDALQTRTDLETFVSTLMIQGIDPNRFTWEETLGIIECCESEIPYTPDEFGYGSIRSWLRMVSQETMEHAVQQIVGEVLEQLGEVLGECGLGLSDVETTPIDWLVAKQRTLTTDLLTVDEFRSQECPPEKVVWRIRHNRLQWTVLVPRTFDAESRSS